MHRYIGTDNGLECFVCGLVLDWTSPDQEPDPAELEYENAARALAFGLHRPGLNRAHHYVLEGRPDGGYVLVCAYDSTTVDGLTSPADVDPECKGG